MCVWSGGCVHMCIGKYLCAKVFVRILDYFLISVLPEPKYMGFYGPKIQFANHLSNHL